MTVKKIAIFGATGRTGLTTLAQAVQAGRNRGGWGSREHPGGELGKVVLGPGREHLWPLVPSLWGPAGGHGGRNGGLRDSVLCKSKVQGLTMGTRGTPLTVICKPGALVKCICDCDGGPRKGFLSQHQLGAQPAKPFPYTC